jgi:hypothetical protein
MESGESESAAHLSALAPHQLQGVLDAALRSSSLAASPHVDVVDGAVAIKVDKRSILQLVTAATVSNSQGGQQVRRVGLGHAAKTGCAGDLRRLPAQASPSLTSKPFPHLDLFLCSSPASNHSIGRQHVLSIVFD